MIATPSQTGRSIAGLTYELASPTTALAGQAPVPLELGSPLSSAK